MKISSKFNDDDESMNADSNKSSLMKQNTRTAENTPPDENSQGDFEFPKLKTEQVQLKGLNEMDTEIIG